MARREVVRGETVGTTISNIDENFKELYNVTDDLSDSIDNIVDGVTAVGKVANKLIIETNTSSNTAQAIQRQYNGAAEITLGTSTAPIHYAQRAFRDGNGKLITEYANLVEDVKVNGTSVLSNKVASITVPTKVSDLTNDENYIKSSSIGVASGVASLDATGKVPQSQLPSYVDDVLEYTNKSNFPTTGETGKIYVAKDTNITYRWSGTSYVEISASLALGETSSTAYAGNKGKANRDDIDKIIAGTTVVPNAENATTATTANKVANSLAVWTTTDKSSGQPTYSFNGSAKVEIDTIYQANKVTSALTLGVLKNNAESTVTFDGSATQSVGTSSNPIYFATRALQDGSGNTISSTYLTTSSASSTYLSKTTASSTYLSKTDASSTYLTKTSASTTYATIASAQQLVDDLLSGAIVVKKAANDEDGNNIKSTYATKTEVADAISKSAVYTKLYTVSNITATSWSSSTVGTSLQNYFPVAVYNSSNQQIIVDVTLTNTGYFTITSDSALGTIKILLNYAPTT